MESACCVEKRKKLRNTTFSAVRQSTYEDDVTQSDEIRIENDSQFLLAFSFVN